MALKKNLNEPELLEKVINFIYLKLSEFCKFLLIFYSVQINYIWLATGQRNSIEISKRYVIQSYKMHSLSHGIKITLEFLKAREYNLENAEGMLRKVIVDFNSYVTVSQKKHDFKNLNYSSKYHLTIKKSVRLNCLLFDFSRLCDSHINICIQLILKFFLNSQWNGGLITKSINIWTGHLQNSLQMTWISN